MAKNVCDVPECGEEIPEGRGSMGGLAVCDKHRSRSYYWKKQGLGAMAKRVEKLHEWERCLDYLSPRIREMISDAKTRVRSARRRASGDNGARH